MCPRLNTWRSALVTQMFLWNFAASQQSVFSGACADVYPKSTCLNYKSVNSCHVVFNECQLTCRYCSNPTVVVETQPPFNHYEHVGIHKAHIPGWSQWGGFGGCSASCGTGHRTRYRHCNGNYCPGNSYEFESCYIQFCPTVPLAPGPEPYWSHWGRFGECSASCGSGIRTRYRDCLGNYCHGSSYETESCYLLICPIPFHIAAPAAPTPYWAPWGDFGGCSVTCGTGVMTRYRMCTQSYCPGGQGTTQTDSVECNLPKCQTQDLLPVPYWSPWGLFGQCSVTCGVGVMTRYRQCVLTQCVGSSSDTKQCFPRDCPLEVKQQMVKSGEYENTGCRDLLPTCESSVNADPQSCFLNIFTIAWCKESCGLCSGISGVWRAWKRSGECSVTCGGGTITYIRMCGGGSCIGRDSKKEKCNTNNCIGSWGPWTSSKCSKSCGDGIARKKRKCTNGRCVGLSSTTVDCNIRACPGVWRPWKQSGKCSATCGGGTISYVRTCERGSCSGQDSKDEKCNTHECIGSWGAWTALKCSKSCGDGIVRKSRKCSGGRCVGSSSKTEKCSIKPCPGVWGSWEKSGNCSKKCGGGNITYIRKCKTESCVGQTTREDKCNTHTCYGTWGSWVEANPCSKSCGVGYTTNTRKCSNSNCVGFDTKRSKCNTKKCPGPEKCSEVEIIGRIVGGTKANIRLFPWMVIVVISNPPKKELCGGSLIQSRWVLTAGHCLISSSVSVHAGIEHLSEISSENRYSVSRVIRHSSGLINDIGLLELSKPVPNSPKTAPIRFTGYRFPTGTKCFAAGWGSSRYGGGPSTELKQVDLKILDGSLCKEAYKNETVEKVVQEENKVICAGSETKQKDICEGDSGGPLMCKVGPDWYITGVASFGPRGQCAVKGSPSVFTRVNAYLPWIFRQIFFHQSNCP